MAPEDRINEIVGQHLLSVFLCWSASESVLCPGALRFLPATEAHSSASSGNAHGLARIASSRVFLLSRSSRLRALAALARTRFGNRRQKAARFSPPA